MLVKSGQLCHQVGICLLYLLTMTSLLLKKGKLGHQLHVMSMDGLLVLILLLVLYFLTFMESWDQPFVGYTSVLKGPHLDQRLKKKNTISHLNVLKVMGSKSVSLMIELAISMA